MIKAEEAAETERQIVSGRPPHKHPRRVSCRWLLQDQVHGNCRTVVSCFKFPVNRGSWSIFSTNQDVSLIFLDPIRTTMRTYFLCLD